MRAAIILLLTGACVVAVLTQWESPVRTGLALLFLFAAPGLAVAEAVGVSGLAPRVTFATAGSLALETLLALALVYAGLFSVRLAIVVLALFTVAALALALARGRGRKAPAGDESADPA